MNLFRLVLKQMRQRTLGTTLTVLSVALGVALATAILILGNESDKLFGQSDYGYDVLVGRAGSPTQLVLNTVYLIDKSPGNIKYSLYERLASSREWQSQIAINVPFAVGDSYEGFRIMAVGPALFGMNDRGEKIAPERTMPYRDGKYYETAEGKFFHPQKLEAVLGAEVAAKTGRKVGDKIKATHGMPAPGVTPDIHDVEWTITGILKPTRTATDRAVFIPLVTFYAIFEHEEAVKGFDALRERNADIAAPSNPQVGKEEDHDHEGHDHAEEGHDHDHPEHFHLEPDGTVHITLPKAQWEISGMMLKSRGVRGMGLASNVNNLGTEAVAVNPASVMRDFFSTFLRPTRLLLLIISILVSVVAGVGILVGIYNSVAARRREIAILRALGATKTKVLTIICLEAGLVGLIGCVLGIGMGLAGAAIGSLFLERELGTGIAWYNVGNQQLLWYSIGVVVLAVLAGLVPALKAYSTPVATNLVAD